MIASAMNPAMSNGSVMMAHITNENRLARLESTPKSTRPNTAGSLECAEIARRLRDDCYQTQNYHQAKPCPSEISIPYPCARA